MNLVDKKHHFDHATRKGKVTAIGAGVVDVAVGDVVVFRGDAGRTMDYDPSRKEQMDERTHRWLSMHEVMAVEEVVDA